MTLADQDPAIDTSQQVLFVVDGLVQVETEVWRRACLGAFRWDCRVVDETKCPVVSRTVHVDAVRKAFTNIADQFATGFLDDVIGQKRLSVPRTADQEHPLGCVSRVGGTEVLDEPLANVIGAHCRGANWPKGIHLVRRRDRDILSTKGPFQ